jgi:hypothetical protein
MRLNPIAHAILSLGLLSASANAAANTPTESAGATTASKFTLPFFTKAEEDPALSEIKTKLEALPNDLESRQSQLMQQFRLDVAAHPALANDLLKIYLSKDASLAPAYMRAVLDTPSAGSSAFPDEQWEEVKTLLSVTDPEIYLENVQKLIKKYPDLAVGILQTANQQQIVSETALITATEGNFVDALSGMPKWAFLGAIAVAAAAGGGGGGGGSSTATCGGGSCTELYDPADFVTSEYSAQEGLALVNAKNLYAYGGTGSGIKVAVLDTGIHATHSDLDDQIESGGFDYQTNSSSVTTDGDGHGTHVSGIIAAEKNSSGMHGIAYDAKIVPFKVFNDSGTWLLTSDLLRKDAFYKARQSGAMIVNNSWGNSTSITTAGLKSTLDSSYPNWLAELQTDVDSGMVIVFSSGNDYSTQITMYGGLPYLYPDLESGWLAVMSVDPDGDETLYTNRCGVAANWCLAAPGGGDTQSTQGIYSTYNDGGYKRLSGTSMAAPMVSGALAALKSRFPNLSYQQVRDRLLVTADSSGQYADSTIFGHGLMDLNAAASPVGVTMFTLTGRDTGLAYTTTGSNLDLPASLYNAFASQLASTDIMIVDSYQRAPFYTKATNFISSNRLEFDTNLSGLFQANREISESGLTLFKENGQVTSFAGNLTATDNMLGIRWFVGEDKQSNLHQSLGLNPYLISGNGTIAGMSLQWGESDLSSFRMGAWSNSLQDTETTTTSRYFVPANLQGSLTISALEQGMGFRKSFALGDGFSISTGAGLGRPADLANSLSSAGAFSASADSAFYLSGSIGFNHDLFSTELSAQRIRLNTKDQPSLLETPERIDLNDFNLSFKRSVASGKGSIGLTAGMTMLSDDSKMTLRIPVSVNETGSVGFLNLTESMSTLYDHTRLSFNGAYQINRDLEFAGVATSYGADASQVTDNYFVGGAFNLRF